MQAEKEKEQGIEENQQLNTAFVDGELNKTSTLNNESSNWNLLDDPQMLKDEEADYYNQNFIQTSQKSKLSPGLKNIGGMESSIRFQQKGLKSNLQPNKTKFSAEEDDEEDLKDLLSQVFKPNKK